jgi:hypothetical protein
MDNKLAILCTQKRNIITPKHFTKEKEKKKRTALIGFKYLLLFPNPVWH